MCCRIHQDTENVIGNNMVKRKEISMDENKLKLLKFALKMGEVALEKVYDVSDYCENLDDDYYYMKEELAKLLGVDYGDLSD